MWILPKSNKSSDTYIDSATTSKSSPINIVELFSNLTVNHSDVGPFLAYSSTFQYESCPSQIPQQIHALTPPRRAREILSTSLSCFQISLSTILMSDRSLPIQTYFNVNLVQVKCVIRYMHLLRHDEQEQSYQHRWVAFKSHCQPFGFPTVPCLFNYISIGPSTGIRI